MPEETAEYNGKKYRKLKSLAPVEVLKDIKTECEKNHFIPYYHNFSFFDDHTLKIILEFCKNSSERLPWLIRKGYLEEVRDEREEHFDDKYY